MTLTAAARRLRVTKQALSLYCRSSSKIKAKKPTPNAEVLFRACVDLGFTFEFDGRSVTAVSVSEETRKLWPPEQLAFNFSRQFQLTGEDGQLSVTVRRPQGRIELSVSMKATA
jgi:hypothetical protein